MSGEHKCRKFGCNERTAGGLCAAHLDAIPNCRVVGCGERVVSTGSLGAGIAFARERGNPLPKDTGGNDQNHGFCDMHIASAPPGLIERWMAATSMDALRDIWSEIAAHFAQKAA